MIARVLSIAGTDPTGGAGLQADVKSIAAAGGYGMGGSNLSGGAEYPWSPAGTYP